MQIDEPKGWSFPTTGARLHLSPDATAEGTTTTTADDTGGDFNDFGGDLPPDVTTVSSADDQATPADAPGDPAQTPATPADPNLASGDRRRQAATQAAQPAAWRGIREVATELGFQFGDGITDDNAALVHLIQQANTAKQRDYYAELGRQIQPHASKIQQYIAQQQQAAPATTPSPWDKPEFDPRWAALVERNPETGVYVGKPGVPPEIVGKVNDYVQWAERRESDPEGYHEHVASKVFERMFAERMTQYTQQTAQQQAIGDIQRSNAGWLYQHDEQGQFVFGRDGRPVASPAGQRYLQHVQSVSRMGVTDPRYQDQLARQALQAEILTEQVQGQQRAAAQAANPQTRQARTPTVQNPLQTQPAAQRVLDPHATEPTMTGFSLADALRRDLNDLADSDFGMDQ